MTAAHTRISLARHSLRRRSLTAAERFVLHSSLCLTVGLAVGQWIAEGHL
jgi:hypothetical protein